MAAVVASRRTEPRATKRAVRQAMRRPQNMVVCIPGRAGERKSRLLAPRPEARAGRAYALDRRVSVAVQPGQRTPRRQRRPSRKPSVPQTSPTASRAMKGCRSTDVATAVAAPRTWSRAWS